MQRATMLLASFVLLSAFAVSGSIGAEPDQPTMLSRYSQSALHPAGPAAAEIAWLWWAMCWAFTAVFVLVMVLVFVAILRKPRGSFTLSLSKSQPPLGGNGFVVAGGLLLPILVLTPLFLLSLRTSASLSAPPAELTIRITGRMWWWDVRYPDLRITSANEINIPAGEPVRLEMTSTDVIHSLWIPRLHGKRDMIPGLETTFWIQADEPGVFRGQCAEYCGTQHANMALHVVALPRDQFDAWAASQQAPPAEPASEAARRGARVFQTAGCAQCHRIEGTPAIGNAGPDLTRIGSRRTIAAAMLPNTRGNLAGWIANPQAIKPGAKMPRTYLTGEELLDLVAYLEERK